MKFIDTHSHIYGEEFDADREEMIQRAKAAGAACVLLPNIDAASMEPMLALCHRHQGFCYPMMGLHPTELPEHPQPLLERMEAAIAADRHAAREFVAIGEVGVDLYWDASRREEQLEVFRLQALWSIRYQLPLVVHSRSAHAELLQVLAPLGSKLCGGIFHCFGGTAEEARELLSFDGFFLGIGGVVTFKKSTLPEILRQSVPLERVVIETDAPYLAPTPHRGKRNEPAFLPLVIERLAEVYGVTAEEVAAVTTENARRLFRLP